MDYLYPPYAKSNSGSLRSYDSICSSISSRGGGEVHINAAYDCSERSDVMSSSHHDYEDLQSVRTDVKQLPTQGPRRKANDLYEPTGPLKERVRQITQCLDDADLQSIRTDFKDLSVHSPRSKTNDLYESTGPAMKHRVRQITECSDDSTASSVSTDSFPWKRDSCLSKLILFLILAFSVAALVLVILLINGTVGPNCGCKDFNAENKDPAPSTGLPSVSIQNLLRRIEDLENNMMAMEAKMKARDSAVEMFVTKHERQVKVLQAQVNKTADKVAVVDGVWVNMTNTRDAFEKKLDTEFKQLNKSVKELSNSDNKITSTVDELRENQILTKRMNERLAVNVTQLKSHVQELRKTGNNISNRAASLEKGYTKMNNLMKTLQAINGAQNASHQDLQSVHNLLRDSINAVNTTLFDKLKPLGSNSGKPAANFSTCKHRRIAGTATTATSISGTSDVFYREPKGQRAMGITCSTDYGRHYKLSEVTQGPYKFRCICKHLSPVFGSKPKTMRCYLHVWECPI
ncbi:hypothetical protein ACROYT_G022463 [Oculina patagonica]